MAETVSESRTQIRLPEFVTKYCNDDALKGMLEGEFWFSSLKFLRDAESTNGLMSDDREGIIERRLKGGNFATIRHPFHDKDHTLHHWGTENPIVMMTETNPYVFCTSIGSYSLAHHHQMMNGNEVYKGEPNNRNYICIYTPLFFDALLLHINAVRIDSRPEVESVLYDAEDEEVNFDFVRQDRWGDVVTAHSVFSKPKRFAIENEFRFAFGIADQDILKVRSMAMTRSIAAFGTLPAAES